MKQITFRLKSGQLLKEEMEKRVAEEGLQAGVLLSIVGSLEKACLRMAGATPEHQNVKEWEEPFEIVGATGTFSSDGCHIHIALADKEGKVIGGHLKDGCRVKTTAEVVIGVFDDVSYQRVLDQQTGFPELEIK